MKKSAVVTALALAVLSASSSSALAGTSAGSPSAAAQTTRIGSTELVGKCTYVGVTTLNGRIQFAFGGSVESYSTDPTRQPQATQAVCRLESPTQGGVPGSEPTYNQTTSIALAGAVAPTPLTLTVPLQLRPVNICVSGFGVYGPNTEGNPKILIETCSTNALRSNPRDSRHDEGLGVGTQVAGAILAVTQDVGGDGLLTCTLDLVSSVGNRPFPTTPFNAVTYAVNTANDGVDYVFCVVI